LGFHVIVAPQAIPDHNTSTPRMALTQFIQILLFAFSPAVGTPSPENQCLTSSGFCLIAELTPSSEERLKSATVHLSTVVTTQGAYRRSRGRVRAKALNRSHGERQIYGGVQGNCRRREKIDESNVVFSGTYVL